MYHRGFDDAAHRRQRVEQCVAVAGGREATVEHRNDAPVLAAPDEAPGTLREHKRGGREVHVSEPVAAGSLGCFAARLGEGFVGTGEGQTVDDDENAARTGNVHAHPEAAGGHET